MSRLLKSPASLIVTASLLCGQGGAAQPADGRALFESKGCYQCHGYQGQGGAAARLARNAYPLEAFTRFIRRPLNEMPPYSRAVLSDAELAAIYGYVRTLPGPAADIQGTR